MTARAAARMEAAEAAVVAMTEQWREVRAERDTETQRAERTNELLETCLGQRDKAEAERDAARRAMLEALRLGDAARRECVELRVRLEAWRAVWGDVDPTAMRKSELGEVETRCEQERQRADAAEARVRELVAFGNEACDELGMHTDVVADHLCSRRALLKTGKRLGLVE